MNSCAGKRSRTHSWSLSGSKLLLVARREFGAVQLVATLTVVVATVLSWPSLAAAGETKNVILITMDGLRWQELFTGADQRLMTKDAGQVDQPEQLRQRYFRESHVERRALLMPFFWNRIAKEGQRPVRVDRVETQQSRGRGGSEGELVALRSGQVLVSARVAGRVGTTRVTVQAPAFVG